MTDLGQFGAGGWATLGGGGAGLDKLELDPLRRTGLVKALRLPSIARGSWATNSTPRPRNARMILVMASSTSNGDVLDAAGVPVAETALTDLGGGGFDVLDAGFVLRPVERGLHMPFGQFAFVFERETAAKRS